MFAAFSKEGEFGFFLKKGSVLFIACPRFERIVAEFRKERSQTHHPDRLLAMLCQFVGVLILFANDYADKCEALQTWAKG